MILKTKLIRIVILYTGLFFALTITSCLAQVVENVDEAFANASSANKKVLLVFSGSDWCAPCVQLDRTILSSNAFLHFANDNLIILKADFPQRKKLSREKQVQNDALAEKYNPTGEFPEMVLLRSDKSVVTKLTYTNQTPDQFITEITSYLSK